MRTGPAGRRVTLLPAGTGVPHTSSSAAAVRLRRPHECCCRVLSARPWRAAVMPGPGRPHYLPCGCERTAGTSATAIASEATAQTAPTAKARAKS